MLVGLDASLPEVDIDFFHFTDEETEQGRRWESILAVF